MEYHDINYIMRMKENISIKSEDLKVYRMDLFSLLGLRTHWVFLAVFTPSLYICKILLFIIREELIYFQPAWIRGEVRLKGRNWLPLTSTVVTCSGTEGTCACSMHIIAYFSLFSALLFILKKNQVLIGREKKPDTLLEKHSAFFL